MGMCVCVYEMSVTKLFSHVSAFVRPFIVCVSVLVCMWCVHVCVCVLKISLPYFTGFLKTCCALLLSNPTSKQCLVKR